MTPPRGHPDGGAGQLPSTATATGQGTVVGVPVPPGSPEVTVHVPSAFTSTVKDSTSRPSGVLVPSGPAPPPAPPVGPATSAVASEC